ncbi:thioesterase [Pusillimonas sp. T7-7]|uniref:thioesterase II family protein n=1 Tax=Pusillimonas sp. (strain T7-7) TaxID=1007105 RepID=UPI0002085336|nr:alpha/beta fold hydrolase [Pusillimonas sp. T7-7]AEC21910.1 thioesterase [Pusillimonas sp. T7-7]
MPYAVDNSEKLTARQWQWLLRVRGAVPGQPTFVFFPHAGATPLSVGRLASLLPRAAGVIVAVLPRGSELDDGVPLLRVTDAAQGVAQGMITLLDADAAGSTRLVLVGNSYGALLAYETAWRLVRAAVSIERLIVSGFRSPILPLADTPLYRLPLAQLRSELSARFGVPPDAGPAAVWGGELAEQALRADLQACDTYRHQHDESLPIPISVLHLTGDASVSLEDLKAWKAVSRFPVSLTPCDAGHFPWAGQPDAMVRTLLELVADG